MYRNVLHEVLFFSSIYLYSWLFYSYVISVTFYVSKIGLLSYCLVHFWMLLSPCTQLHIKEYLSHHAARRPSVSSLRRQPQLLAPLTPPSCGRCTVIDQWCGCGVAPTVTERLCSIDSNRLLVVAEIKSFENWKTKKNVRRIKNVKTRGFPGTVRTFSSIRNNDGTD